MFFWFLNLYCQHVLRPSRIRLLSSFGSQNGYIHQIMDISAKYLIYMLHSNLSQIRALIFGGTSGIYPPPQVGITVLAAPATDLCPLVRSKPSNYYRNRIHVSLAITFLNPGSTKLISSPSFLDHFSVSHIQITGSNQIQSCFIFHA